MEARSRHVDTAVACLLDFARGAIRAQDHNGDPLMYAVDIAHDLKASPIRHQRMRFQHLTGRFYFLVFRGTW
jgi:hypothetical protein